EGDAFLLAPAFHIGKVEVLDGPQSSLSGRSRILVLREQATLIEAFEGVQDVDRLSVIPELLAEVRDRTSVEAGGNQFIQPTLQDGLPEFGQDEDALAREDL